MKKAQKSKGRKISYDINIPNQPINIFWSDRTENNKVYSLGERNRYVNAKKKK